MESINEIIYSDTTETDTETEADTETDTETDIKNDVIYTATTNGSVDNVSHIVLNDLICIFENNICSDVEDVFDTLLRAQTLNNNNLIAFDQFPGLFKAILKDGLPNVLPNLNMELLNRYADDDESTGVCMYDTGTMMLRCIVRFLDIYSRLNNNNQIQVYIPWLRNVLIFLSILQKKRILNTIDFLIRCRTYNDSEFVSDSDSDDSFE